MYVDCRKNDSMIRPNKNNINFAKLAMLKKTCIYNLSIENKIYEICYHPPTIQSSSFFHIIHQSEKPEKNYIALPIDLRCSVYLLS